MGTPEFSVPVLDTLVGAHEVVAVYTQPPRPAGRGKKERRSPVHLRAAALGLCVRHPVSMKGQAEQRDFAAFEADVAVVVAYGLILPLAVLQIPPFGCLNVHASLLPRWRGAAPIHRAVLAGDAETGICVMIMNEGLDTGPVLLREATRIGAEETSGMLHDRLSGMGALLMVQALAGLGTRTAVAQSSEGVTYAAKIAKPEAQIDWSLPAIGVDRQIRGMSPFPGAWCMIGGERVKVLRSRLADGTGMPGQVLRGMVVACGDGAIEIVEAQRQGKRAMLADDLLRGWPLPPVLG